MYTFWQITINLKGILPSGHISNVKRSFALNFFVSFLISLCNVTLCVSTTLILFKVMINAAVSMAAEPISLILFISPL